MDFGLFLKREKRETGGVWIKLTSDKDDPGEVLVLGDRAPVYKGEIYRLFAELGQRHGGDVQNVPEKLREEAMIKAMAEKLLLNWRGITNEGVEIPYSKEKALEMLTQSTYFQDLVAGAAMQAENIISAANRKDEEDLKKASAPASNSPKQSATPTLLGSGNSRKKRAATRKATQP